MVPAHAGVIPKPRKDMNNAGGGPRTCGGDPATVDEEEQVTVWSPHMRG